MSDGRTFTPKHLQILKYLMSTGRTWVSLQRAERECRINGEKLAISEELLELTAKPANLEPLVELHPSGKHYRITPRGVEACSKYAVKTLTIDFGNKKKTVEKIVLAATMTEPKAELTAGMDDLPPDDDEDDLPPPEPTDSLTTDAPGAQQEDDVYLDPDPELDQTEPAPAEKKPAPADKTRTKPAGLPKPARPIGTPASQTIPTAPAPQKRRSLPKKN